MEIKLSEVMIQLKPKYHHPKTPRIKLLLPKSRIQKILKFPQRQSLVIQGLLKLIQHQQVIKGDRLSPEFPSLQLQERTKSSPAAHRGPTALQKIRLIPRLL